MGKKSGSAPAAPDPVATASAQGSSNRDTAIAQSRLNQVDEYTPYGQSIFTQTGDPVDGIQRFRRDTTLSPDQQALSDQQSAISGQLQTIAGDQVNRVGTSLAAPFSYAGMPGAPQADSAARQQTIDSLYGQFQSRLDPRFNQERTALETRLANQGIGLNSDAYRQEMESFGRTRNDAYQSAQNQAIAGGGAEQSRLFGLQGSERERAIQEAAYLRGIPLNEASALMGASGGVTMPQFSPTPQTSVGGVDYMGAANNQYMGQLGAYNTQQQSAAADRGGLYGLAGTAAMAGAYYGGR